MSASPRRPRLLFVYQQPTSFVKDDLALLRERYDVRAFAFDANRFSTRTGRLGGLLGYGAWELAWLLRELPRADLVFGWFADYHLALPALLARRFGVPLAVVSAGMDANHLPELNYGTFQQGWRAALARLVCRRAAVLLPVAQALVYAETRYATWPDARPQGLRARVPNLKTPCTVIPFGFEAVDWPAGPAKRPPVVATVALIGDDRTLRVKGVDLLFEAARRLPNVRFQVVGMAETLMPFVRETYAPPPNVALLPPRPRAELPAVYGGASVYAQLSRTEGMPNVLCEAMLCGCVPVGSAVAGIPEVIGAAGFVVERPEPARLAAVLREALDAATPEARQQARRRIRERFSREQRRQALVTVLERVRRSPREKPS